MSQLFVPALTRLQTLSKGARDCSASRCQSNRLELLLASTWQDRGVEEYSSEDQAPTFNYKKEKLN